MSRYSRNSGYTIGGPVNLGGVMTPIVKYLIIINFVVFFFEILLGENVKPFILFFGLVPQKVLSDLYLWQPLTYGFLHSPVDPFHIILNMLMLWLFGIGFERMWGARRFLLFYLIGGLAGGAAVVLAALLFGSPRYIPTIGASGAIYALIMAFGVWFPEQRINIYFFIPVKAKWVVWGIVFVTLLYAITVSDATVSYAAHGGGLFAGYIMTSGIYRPPIFRARMKRLGLKLRETAYKIELWILRRKHRHLRRLDKDDDEYYH
ncbi:MAG: hypothetical protein Kow0090_21820 [Myxococcota bacterium]